MNLIYKRILTALVFTVIGFSSAVFAQTPVADATAPNNSGTAKAGASKSDELSFRQKILLPGPLISGHAEYENQCELCHSSFEKSKMESLCIDCHEDIAADRQSKSGFHGKSGPSATDACNTCHKDHEGRDADMTGLFKDAFNHDATNFALEGAHVGLSCASCHEDDKKFREAEPECVACHREDDVHKGGAGEECSTCHQAQSWQSLLEFDHDTTDFPLVGKHEEVSCNSCHIAQKFEFEESEQQCVSCHLSKDIHGGSNGTECENCHNEKTWETVDFDHDETEFPLRGGHQDVPCRACHKEGDRAEDAPTDCYSCHANEDVHFGRNGKDCHTCHNDLSWLESIFDHNRDTQYPLTGKHKEVKCTECHTGALTDSLPRDCAGCHKADDIHKTEEMAVCGLCHSTERWNLTQLFDHDFTGFPLIGMHRIVPCQTCHIGNQFSATEKTCVACHAFDDVHKDTLGSDCALCHNPNAWNPWQFDHNKQTDFPLQGKHVGLDCEACHTPGTKADAITNVCGDCHQSQDIHNGNYGNRCGRCHSNDSFKELFLP